MGLATLAGQSRPRVHQRGCGIATWEASLTDEQRAGLVWALEHNFPMTQIHREAVADGLDAKYDAFRKHFMAERGCPCGPR